MSFPTLPERSSEKNSKILRAHEFLRQSNQLVQLNIINAEGRKTVSKLLSKMVGEAKSVYEHDEKRSEIRENGKLREKLKDTQQTSMGVLEDWYIIVDISRQVQKKTLDLQRKHYECDQLRKSVMEANAEIRREKEAEEKCLSDIAFLTEDLAASSVSILKFLENSEDVCKLRDMEEEKHAIEVEVEKLRNAKRNLAEEIRVNKATLKAESKKPFKKAVCECAKHYKLCRNLAPKLEASLRNLENLKKEEENRRACGSLDETMQFDRSFVLASMEKDGNMEQNLSSCSTKLVSPQKSPSKSDLNVDYVDKPMEIQDSTINENVVENVVEMTNTVRRAPNPVLPPPMREESVRPEETQRVPINLPIAEAVEEDEDEEQEDIEEEESRDEVANQSMDIMGTDHPMEGIEQDAEDQPFTCLAVQSNQSNPSSASILSANSILETASEQPSQKINSNLNQEGNERVDSNHSDDVRMDTDRLQEEDELSESGSNRSNNFSFNFFGNSKSNSRGGANASGLDNDTNFDFNFGGNGSGDDASGNALDFINNNNGEDGGSASASDPFCFGNQGGTGGGDTSFNFNFDADNDGGSGAGAGGNSTSFFNF